jgi:hypothetical protein
MNGVRSEQAAHPTPTPPFWQRHQYMLAGLAVFGAVGEHGLPGHIERARPLPRHGV